MQYEPIKKSLGNFFAGSLILRKILYLLLDLLLLRSWHVRRALKRLSKEMPKESSVLDAGAGFGQYVWRMSRINRRWKINGADIMSDQVADCNLFFTRCGMAERVVFRTEDLTKLKDSDSYNLVLSVDVMEHIEEDRLVFSNFYKALRNNGVLLISTPSDKGGSDVHDDSEESFIDEHVRDGYSIEDITAKLKEAGFSKVSVQYTYGWPGSISWKISMKYPIKMLNTSYFFFIILPFYYLVFFPFALILNYLDLRLTHKTGTGLLVTALK